MRQHTLAFVSILSEQCHVFENGWATFFENDLLRLKWFAAPPRLLVALRAVSLSLGE